MSENERTEKFTPGPWEWRGQDTWDEELVSLGVPETIDDERWGQVQNNLVLAGRWHNDNTAGVDVSACDAWVLVGTCR